MDNNYIQLTSDRLKTISILLRNKSTGRLILNKLAGIGKAKDKVIEKEEALNRLLDVMVNVKLRNK
jgi:hypothetical protein